MITQRDDKGRITRKYSAKQRKWITKNQYSFSSIQDFLDGFYKKFGEKLSLNGLYGILRQETGQRSIRKVKGKQHKDWQERIDYLKEHYPYEDTKSLTNNFNKLFHDNYSAESLRDFCNNYGIKKDKDYHKSFPEKRKPIGSTMKGFIKVRNDKLPRHLSMKNYMPINRYVFEQSHGKIADGYKVLPYDGNSENSDIDNLYIANKREILWLKNQNALGKGIITKAALENIRLEQVLIDKGIVVKQKYDPNRLKKWNEKCKEQRRLKKQL